MRSMKRKLPLRIPGAAFVAVELALFSFQSVAQTPAPRSRTCGSAFAAAAPAGEFLEFRDNLAGVGADAGQKGVADYLRHFQTCLS